MPGAGKWQGEEGVVGVSCSPLVGYVGDRGGESVGEG